MKCAYCDRPAKYLCDHRLGPDQTCDRPLSFDRCPDHAPTVSTKE